MMHPRIRGITLLFLCLAGLVQADPNDPVVFNDANLEAVIESILGPDPTEAQMLGLHILNAISKGIADLTGMEYALNMDHMVMFNNNITDISPLTGLTGMDTLNLFGNQISDINALAGMTSLDQLYIRDNNISDISALSGMIGLDVLYLQNNQISNISPLSGLLNLDTLFLDDNTFISDISPLSGLTNLEYLGLSSNNISDINALSGLTNLNELELSDNQISDLSPLSGLTPGLFFLYLGDNQISDLSPLSGLTDLFTLSLNNNPISDINALSGLTELRDLYLSNNNNLADITALSSVTKLRNLDLSHNQISNIAPLSGLINSSVELNLSHNNISHISPLTGLGIAFVDFNLSHNQISDVSSLSGMSIPFAIFNLSHNQISDISALATLSGSVLLVDDLDLRSNPLNDAAYQTHIPTIEGNGYTVLYWWTLTTSSTTGGSVTAPGEGAFSYDDLTVVPVTATPDSHYHFIDWTGTAVDANQVADPNSANTSVTMDAYYNLQANFAIDQHTLTTSSSSGGSVTVPGEGVNTYDYGTVVDIEATPDAHYHFANWTGPASDANVASTTVTMTGDVVVQANFAIDQHTLNTSSNTGGSVTVPGEGVNAYDYGTVVNLTATPEAHYHFIGWTGSVADANAASTSVTMTGDMVVQANFAIDQHTLTISTLFNGSVTTPGQGAFTYDYGTLVPITATPAGDSLFDQWQGAAVNAGKVSDPQAASSSVLADADYTLIAKFISPPNVSTYDVLLVSETSALLRGALVNDGGGACESRFRYWVQSDPIHAEQTTNWQAVTDNDIFTALITGLLPDTTYRYVSEARNAAGMDVGSQKTFTTLPLDPNNIAPQTLFVDASAPFDPNAEGNGTENQPFNSIQQAIDAANQHDTIQVAPGGYYETLDLMGKNLHLNGLDPNTTKVTDLPVIDANGLGPVITFAEGEDANCMVTGFVLTGGLGELAGAVACINSSPLIQNCLIVGNRFSDPNGGAIYLQDSNSVFINVTIADNAGLNGGSGVTMLNSDPTILNSILWNDIPIEILALDLSAPDVTYSTVAGSWPGTGNLSGDPLFAAPGLWVDPNDPNVPLDPINPDAVFLDGDYHLMSEAGRFNPMTNTWVIDDATSPAIDAGDTLSDWTVEPVPNGECINQGAYGGTSQASQSPE